MGRLLEIEVQADDVDQEFGTITERFDNDGELWMGVSKTLDEIAHRNLRRETGGPEFGTWPALAESTIEDRRRQGYGDRPMLKRTGDLYKAVTAEAGLHSAEVGIESSAPGFYGRFHDVGEGQRQRSFLYLLEEDMEGIQDVIGDFYVDGTMTLPQVAA